MSSRAVVMRSSKATPTPGTLAASRLRMIKKIGRKWVLYDSKGTRVLGRHDTHEDALRQERAIQISKARKAGHHIPPRPG